VYSIDQLLLVALVAFGCGIGLAILVCNQDCRLCRRREDREPLEEDDPRPPLP